MKIVETTAEADAEEVGCAVGEGRAGSSRTSTRPSTATLKATRADNMDNFQMRILILVPKGVKVGLEGLVTWSKGNYSCHNWGGGGGRDRQEPQDVFIDRPRHAHVISMSSFGDRET